MNPRIYSLFSSKKGEKPSNSSIALGRAIIYQALLDATLKGKRNSLIRHQAQTWLLGLNKDLLFVCDLACLQVDEVQERAKTLIDGKSI